MRIGVPAQGEGLEASPSAIFGRSPYYVLVDSDTMAAETIPNPATGASGGAGVQASQWLIGQGIEAVIAANVGPNASAVLQAAGIQVYALEGDTVRAAVEALAKGRLEPLAGPTVASHTGTSGQGAGQPNRADELAGEAAALRSRLDEIESQIQELETDQPRCCVAVSVDGDQGLDAPVAMHFGRCPFFVVADLQGGQVVSSRTVTNPYYPAHEPGQVPSFIASLEANVMLSGGMGGRAAQLFAEAGIEAVTGAAGTVRDALQAYLAGEISGATPCEHH
jgi:predicted Fe-Mo cluster-binding NifX family protein